MTPQNLLNQSGKYSSRTLVTNRDACIQGIISKELKVVNDKYIYLTLNVKEKYVIYKVTYLFENFLLEKQQYLNHILMIYKA